MEEAKHICVYSGSAHPELSQQIANYLGISLGKVHLTHFPDGEIFVQFEENVRRAAAFLLQPTCKPPNDNLMELLIMIDAARRASAARISAVLPFFGYARQDRKDKPRGPISAMLVANLLTVAGADRIITMDLHAQQIQGCFDIPVDHLYARPVLVPYLKKLIGNRPAAPAPREPSSGADFVELQSLRKQAAGYMQNLFEALTELEELRRQAEQGKTADLERRLDASRKAADDAQNSVSVLEKDIAALKSENEELSALREKAGMYEELTVKFSQIENENAALRAGAGSDASEGAAPAQMEELIYKIQKKIVRRWLLVDKKRVDGRAMNQIRPLAAEVGVLPRVHGSGLFTRGQTQVLTAATLGTLSEAQMLDGIDNDTTKRYMHHYNMPGFSTGEAKAARSPGRREIGHGALAERSLVPVLPSEEEFPYAIRLVSDVVSSNGSTSQGSVCGSTLALMDAGVPIKAPVAGISCGLITAEDGSWDTMIDIQGLEDFYGDMDFKVAGTHKGITSIQMDLKIDGLTPEIIRQALAQTHAGRDYIIDNVILKAIAQPRPEVSRYAPKMTTMKIDPDKIREVIGKGGATIQKIVADTGAKIDIDDDGTIHIAAVNGEQAEAAHAAISAIVFEPEVGEIYTGKVTGIKEFGCFVEYAPGKEGMVHISKIANRRLERVEDAGIEVGQTVRVKYMGLDKKGRMDFSIKDAQ